MIHQSINKAHSYIPEQWPLQQFIATNPFWEKVSENISTVIRTLAKKVGLKGSLQLVQYHKLYQAKKISSQSLREAIIEVFNLKDKESTVSLIAAFIENPLYQEKLENIEEVTDQFYPESVKILLSYQLKDYFLNLPLDWIKQQCYSFLSAFFDEKYTTWKMPIKSESLFAGWRELISLENEHWKLFLSVFPTNAEDFIGAVFDELKIPDDYQADYIFSIFWELKGWTGYVKWLENHPTNPWIDKKAKLADIIALWLGYEYYFLKKNQSQLVSFTGFKPPAKNTSNDLLSVNNLWLQFQKFQSRRDIVIPLDDLSLRWIWQTAWDFEEHKNLMTALSSKKIIPNNNPKAQWIFCIDTRSEGIRRHIEATAQHETYGFAGFFGFAFQLNNVSENTVALQCPALLQPKETISYVKLSESYFSKLSIAFFNSLSSAKKSLLSPFVLVELFGLWSSLKLFSKTFFPEVAKKLDNKFFKNKKKHISLFDSDAFDLNKTASICEAVLKSIGLTSHFSDTVIIAGHTAITENNPYQAALDCGACGGNSGKVNAIIASQAFNHPEIRKLLNDRGIHIPHSTLFIPACHHTTTDEIIWCKEAINTDGQLEARLAEIEKSIAPALQRLQQERLLSLPGDSLAAERASKWSELIPEWGLANNIAIIIGPRWLTQYHNFKQRIFLHSYEPCHDSDGKLLTTILTAPLIVAHLINMQYYFSSTDPNLFGSGNKALHNICSGLGVMLGNQSDLKFGLPLQSVSFRDELIHEPHRLCCVVYAKQKIVNNIIQKEPLLKSLIDGQWLFLKVIEPQDENQNL